jgi:hypothetical protein
MNRPVKLSVIAGILIVGLAATTHAGERADALKGWEEKSPREEIRPAFSYDVKGGPNGKGSMLINADQRVGLMGHFEKKSRSLEASTTNSPRKDALAILISSVERASFEFDGWTTRATESCEINLHSRRIDPAKDLVRNRSFQQKVRHPLMAGFKSVDRTAHPPLRLTPSSNCIFVGGLPTQSSSGQKLFCPKRLRLNLESFA